MGELRQPFEFVMPDKARQEPFSNFNDNLKAVAGSMNQQSQSGVTSNPVSRSSSSSSNFYRSRTRTPPPLFSTVPLHFAMAPAPAPTSSTTSTAGPTPISINTNLPPSSQHYNLAPLPPPPIVSRKTSTPTPYLSPTSPSAETTTSNSPETHYTPFGSPPRIHYNHYSSQAIDIAGGGYGNTGRHEVDSPSDREGRQPISLLTAMLQQHQKILEDRMRDRQREDIVEGEEEEQSVQVIETGEAACGGGLGLGLTNLSGAVSRPSPQPIIIQSNTPRPILLPPAPSTCALSTAPTTRASSVASAVVVPTAIGSSQTTAITAPTEPAIKLDTAATAPAQVARKSSLTFAVVPQSNNAKAGPSGRRGSLEAADRAMIKNGMIAEEDEEDEGEGKGRGEVDEEEKVEGSEGGGEGSEEALEEVEADDTDVSNESAVENGNATDVTDQTDQEEEQEDEDEEDDYPVKHGSQRPSFTLPGPEQTEEGEEDAEESANEERSEQVDSEVDDVNGNASGYEEDSEAGSSSDEAVARIGSVIARFTTAMRRSPQVKHRFLHRSKADDDEDEVKETHMVKPAGHLSFVDARRPSGSRHQNEDRPRFPFARPTNYRRRRADTVEDLIHGSATSLITPSSFVRIDNDRSPEQIKGKGHINFKPSEMPAGVRRGRSPGGSESCTRHRSPPPSQLRQAFKSRPKAASDICPPAGMSPSAGKMQMRRGVSDSPRKRRARELVANQVFALKSSKSAVLKSEDDTALSSPLSKGKISLAPLPSDVGETSAAAGWRSDDALFAAPTVQRNTSIHSQHSGQGSILAPNPRFARPPTPLSPMRSDRSRSNPSSRPLSPYESDYPGHNGNKSASEKIVGGMISVSRRVSETIANPFGKAESVPAEPPVSASVTEKASGLGPLLPPKTCAVAVDTTPALAASIAAAQAEAPIQRVLHEKLAGCPSRPAPTPEYPEQLIAPLKSGYQSGPGERDLFSPTPSSIGSCAIQAQRGAMTDNESTMTRHKRSKPIVCPLPKTNIAA